MGADLLKGGLLVPRYKDEHLCILLLGEKYKSVREDLFSSYVKKMGEGAVIWCTKVAGLLRK